MYRATISLAAVLIFAPSVVFAAPLTQAQAESLINVVQASPGTPASAFTSLITAFSSIIVVQAESLIAVVQGAPGAPASAFVNLLIAFTVDPVSTPAPVSTNVGTVCGCSVPQVYLTDNNINITVPFALDLSQVNLETFIGENVIGARNLSVPGIHKAIQNGTSYSYGWVFDKPFSSMVYNGFEKESFRIRLVPLNGTPTTTRMFTLDQLPSQVF